MTISPQARTQPRKDDIHVVDLGNGAFWVRHPGSRSCPLDQAWMDEAADKMGRFGSAVSLEQIRSGLSDYRDAANEGLAEKQYPDGVWTSGNGVWTSARQGEEVHVLRPEASAALGYCKWDGDGHYDLSKYNTEKMLPTLGQIVSYVRLMQLPRDGAATVHLTSEGCTAVGALLAGAALVLARHYSAAEAYGQLTDSLRTTDKDWDRFPPPFDMKGTISASSLQVQDCLAGLQAARDLGWLDYRTFDIEAWQLLREKFDASWLVPGECLALGDPAVTAGNPQYPNLLDRRKDRIVEPASTASDTPNSSYVPLSPSTPASFSTKSLGERQRIGSIDSKCTLETGSTCDTELSTEASPSDIRNNPEYMVLERGGFISTFERFRIERMVRLNFLEECRQTEVCPAVFRDAGIRTIQREFQDGSIPSQAVLRGFLADCTNCADSPMAVHCKGGMGRTGVMIAAYAAQQHEVDGKAFLGWARLCRPGTVQTPVQERFVRGLKAGRQQFSPLACLGICS